MPTQSDFRHKSTAFEFRDNLHKDGLCRIFSSLEYIAHNFVVFVVVVFPCSRSDIHRHDYNNWRTLDVLCHTLTFFCGIRRRPENVIRAVTSFRRKR